EPTTHPVMKPSERASVDVALRRKGQKRRETLGQGDLFEHLAGLLEPALLPELLPMTLAQACHLVVGDFAHQVRRNPRPLDQTRRMAAPLPHLRPRDLRRGYILHQIVDGSRADTPHPRLDVLDANAHIEPEPTFG